MSDREAAHTPDKTGHTVPTAATDKKHAIKADAHTSSTVTSIDQKPTPGFLRVKVYTPFKVFYEGDALSVSAKNQTGEFDVLPGIRILSPCLWHVMCAYRRPRRYLRIRQLHER